MTQDQALKILKSGKNVFLTGPAGSGKTYVLNQYIDYLKKQDIGIGVTAPTGIAATHMGGITIHSWSGLGIRNRLSASDIAQITAKAPLRKRYKSTQVLIIDEVSMLHHYRLDLLDTLAKAFKKNDLPFGGMQLILCGDFFQLPPVSTADEPPSRFAYHAKSWSHADLKVCYLEEQHRQKDNNFYALLNAIRENKLNGSHLDILYSRYDQRQFINLKPTKLYTHNINVDWENEKELKKIDEPQFHYHMTSGGKSILVDILTKSCLAPKILKIKKGARVMMVKNNFEEGYANGSLGTVEYCDHENIQIKLTDGKIISVSPATWVYDDNGSIKAQITQYPLRLAWAITIHKSQGMSLDAAEIDLSQSFEKGMGYVALSRIRSLEGLSLKGLNEIALQVDDEVISFDRVFRRLSLQQVNSIDDFIPTTFSQNNEEKKDTLTITLEMIKKGGSLAQIAQIRGLTIGTIINHLEKLKKADQNLDLSIILEAFSLDRINQITGKLENISAAEKVKLNDIKKIIGGDFTFDEIRIAKLLMD